MLRNLKKLYQCPLGLMLHFYKKVRYNGGTRRYVSMPSRAETPFLQWLRCVIWQVMLRINALSGWDSISTNDPENLAAEMRALYQCPLGLVLHFYFQYIFLIKEKEDLSYQCPLGLVLHFYTSHCQPNWIHMFLVSMPSRASTPFLRMSIWGYPR